jgi:hypothetical protein
LRDGLVGAGIGLVIEYMNRAVAHLQEVDVSSDESRFVAERRRGAVRRFLWNDREAVVVFKRGYIVFEEKNRNFDGDGRAVVYEHEALKARMPLVIGADARNDQRRRLGRGVLLFVDNKTVEGEKSGRQLRAARAVFAAKELVRAILVDAFEKIRNRRETGIASAAVVQRARPDERRLPPVNREFINLAVIELNGADELGRREERKAAVAQPLVRGQPAARGTGLSIAASMRQVLAVRIESARAGVIGRFFPGGVRP